MAVGKLGFLSRFKIDRYPSNFNESKIKAPAIAGGVVSGAFRR